MTEKPLLIFEGNCQAQHLAAILESSGAIDAVHVGRDYGFLPSFAGNPCKVRPLTTLGEVIAEARSRGRFVVRCQQTSPLAKVDSESSNSADHVVLFPTTKFYTLRPEKFKETFKVENVSIKRIFDFDIKSTYTSQTKASFSVDVAGYLADNAPRKVLFHHFGHPTGEVMALLAKGIIDQLDGIVPRSSFSQTLSSLSLSEGLNQGTHHPMSTEAMAELGFDWGLEYRIYSSMIEARRLQDWTLIGEHRDFFKYLFFNDTQYWETLAKYALAVGDDEAALTAYAELVSRSPGCIVYWMDYSALQSRLTTQKGLGFQPLLTIMENAEKFFGPANSANLVIGNCLELMGRYGEAKARYETYYRNAKLSPENGREVLALKPLMQLLARRGKLPAVRSWAIREGAASPRARKKMLRLLAKLKLSDVVQEREIIRERRRMIRRKSRRAVDARHGVC